MEKALLLIVLLVALTLTGCNSTQLPTNNTQGEAASVQQQVLLLVPPPPSFLPNPYRGAEFQPTNNEDAIYATYLQNTEMFPDDRVCESNLFERLKGASQASSIEIDWVTKPYLAWGGVWKKRAVVGPVEYLFTIQEAHVTYQAGNDKKVDLTYSCYVQYAKQREQAIWKKGFLKYGQGFTQGHKKYVPTPVSIFTSSLPGKPTDWEPGIKYYREECC
jgi:hypothetical protein